MEKSHYLPSEGTVVRGQDGFSAIDYPLPFGGANVAKITLSDRYPKVGRARNKTSTMIVYIAEGAVTFVSDNESIDLSIGSIILVEAGKTYHWEPSDTVTLLVFSTPAWTPEQHESLPD